MQEKKRGEDERERWEGVREGGVCEREGRKRGGCVIEGWVREMGE